MHVCVCCLLFSIVHYCAVPGRFRVLLGTVHNTANTLNNTLNNTKTSLAFGTEITHLTH